MNQLKSWSVSDMSLKTLSTFPLYAYRLPKNHNNSHLIPEPPSGEITCQEVALIIVVSPCNNKSARGCLRLSNYYVYNSYAPAPELYRLIVDTLPSSSTGHYSIYNLRILLNFLYFCINACFLRNCQKFCQIRLNCYDFRIKCFALI